MGQSLVMFSQHSACINSPSWDVMGNCGLRLCAELVESIVCGLRDRFPPSNSKKKPWFIQSVSFLTNHETAVTSSASDSSVDSSCSVRPPKTLQQGDKVS